MHKRSCLFTQCNWKLENVPRTTLVYLLLLKVLLYSKNLIQTLFTSLISQWRLRNCNRNLRQNVNKVWSDSEVRKPVTSRVYLGTMTNQLTYSKYQQYLKIKKNYREQELHYMNYKRTISRVFYFKLFFTGNSQFTGCANLN